MKGEHSSLWRAVAHEGTVLEIVVQHRRDKQAAKKFLRKLLKGLTYVPRVIITDKLKSYGAAKREMLPGVEHQQHRSLNNPAAHSHQPTRPWERRISTFRTLLDLPTAKNTLPWPVILTRKNFPSSAMSDKANLW